MSYPLFVKLHEHLKHGIEACHEQMLNKCKNRGISDMLVDMAEAKEEVATLISSNSKWQHRYINSSGLHT